MSTLLTIEQTAAELRVSTRTVRRLIAAGDLAVYRQGSRLVRVPATELRRHVAQCTIRAHGAEAPRGRTLAPGERLW